jgi:hypothetical protein
LFLLLAAIATVEEEWRTEPPSQRAAGVAVGLPSHDQGSPMGRRFDRERLVTGAKTSRSS